MNMIFTIDEITVNFHLAFRST